MMTEGQIFQRKVEDELLGANAPRVSGAIEKGHGSAFQRLSPDQRSRHARAEAIVAAEKTEHAARVDLEAAKRRHEAAVTKLNRALSSAGFRTAEAGVAA